MAKKEKRNNQKKKNMTAMSQYSESAMLAAEQSTLRGGEPDTSNIIARNNDQNENHISETAMENNSTGLTFAAGSRNG